jgi:hypothetical protein
MSKKSIEKKINRDKDVTSNSSSISAILTDVDKYLKEKKNWNSVKWEEKEVAEIEKYKFQDKKYINKLKWEKEKRIILDDTADVFPDKKHGLYFIRTSFKKEELEKIVGTDDDKHYNFQERIKKNNLKIKLSLVPSIIDNKHIVYNGEAENVRQRILAHFNGYKGNACLAIGKREVLAKKDNWEYAYISLDDYEIYKDNSKKEIRLFLENAWRYRNGWPILCLD